MNFSYESYMRVLMAALEDGYNKYVVINTAFTYVDS